MIGLVIKDFLILRKTLRTYVLVFALYVGLALTGVWAAEFVGGMMMVMTAVLPMNIFAYDKQAKWDTYGLALPVGRTKTVAARYLCVLLLCLFSFALIAALGLIMSALGRFGDVDACETYMVCCAVCGLIGMLVSAFMVPLMYKFGPERARLFLYGLGGLIVAVAILFFKVFGGAEWLESLGEPTSTQLAAIPFVAAIAGLILLALSFLLSRYFYGAKDV